MSLRDLLRGDSEERERELEVRRAYNILFTSQHGQKVLAHMLAELHFFDEVDTDEERVLSNYAKRLLNHIGVMQGMNVPGIVSAMLRLPIVPPDDSE